MTISLLFRTLHTLIFSFLFFVVNAQSADSPVKGKIICLDPGHGGTASTDNYRVGPTGEREEWINLRVALYLRDMLEEKGAEVVMTRTEDVFIPLADRASISRAHNADVFLSIHHNATADSSVNFPIIYFHGNATENKASVALGKEIGRTMVEHLFRNELTSEGNPVSLVSDFTVFPQAGASVLRNTYGTPAVLAEASFFTNHREEQLLKTEAHNQTEALAYLKALEVFFSKPGKEILPKNSVIPPVSLFKVFQEAERMTPLARRWRQDYEEALVLMKKKRSREQALELFTRSASSFPDSYLAGKCHQYRSKILKKIGRKKEAKEASVRSKEFFVTIPGI